MLQVAGCSRRLSGVEVEVAGCKFDRRLSGVEVEVAGCKFDRRLSGVEVKVASYAFIFSNSFMQSTSA